MNIFYTPNITNTNTFVLDETESKHAIKVLRLNQGDEICLVDGKGSFYIAEINNAHQKKCEVKIIKHEKEENNKPRIHIAIAPTKNNDRLEWFIEKTTEIGISEISPIICDHSERKFLKTERLEKRAISAMKQSLKATLPLINDSINFKNFVNSIPETTEKYIAHCYNENQKHLKEIYPGSKDCVVLIGPEGDFSLQEVELALNNGFTPISLGKSRLRTETAGLVACNILNLINE
ncbi:16S rRNA (uracil(1498)-N(3))-methyltransferase [Vicingus serpentipes]|jgi:16S rRNA (uracil1498-N3)-methyltransferase|uniref:Ribosomal RNA small subunit methyltransferase E n=1 Tax=Vicingus serpentipes TaxID=1926625 RepID=A0A5C6RWM4_9FLAO|nr:16S rRNA (uracil(1498)-N(3))-methyltransferase [Vicingus serpentipes]TXB66956.1 16S rRNA (uracil(1498)-N(3))-methyltransferase [Vicingus serpentipes]